MLQPSLVVLSAEGPLHLLSPGCTALRSRMMSLRIPSRGPLSAHKTPFLQLNTYGLSAFQLLLYHPPPPPFSFGFTALPSFPLSSCFSVRKVRHITLGTRPKRHPQVSCTQTPLSGAFPQMEHLNIIRRRKKEKKKNVDFPIAKKKRQSRGKDSEGNDRGK